MHGLTPFSLVWLGVFDERHSVCGGPNNTRNYRIEFLENTPRTREAFDTLGEVNVVFFGGSHEERPNDPKLSDGGGLARWLHGGGGSSQRDSRSRSLERMVRRRWDHVRVSSASVVIAVTAIAAWIPIRMIGRNRPDRQRTNTRGERK